MMSDDLEVKCYSGASYAERPVSFRWQSREYVVAGVEKSWIEPGERHFKVRTSEGLRFHLVYEATDRWSLRQD